MALSDRRDQLRLLAVAANRPDVSGLDDYEPPSVVLEETLQSGEVEPLWFSDVVEASAKAREHGQPPPEVEHTVIRRLTPAQYLAEFGGDDGGS